MWQKKETGDGSLSPFSGTFFLKCIRILIISSLLYLGDREPSPVSFSPALAIVRDRECGRCTGTSFPEISGCKDQRDDGRNIRKRREKLRRHLREIHLNVDADDTDGAEQQAAEYRDQRIPCGKYDERHRDPALAACHAVTPEVCVIQRDARPADGCHHTAEYDIRIAQSIHVIARRVKCCRIFPECAQNHAGPCLIQIDHGNRYDNVHNIYQNALG